MNTEPTDNYSLDEGASPVLIHAPHGGLVMPEEALESLVISPEELQAELLAMTDLHTDLLAVEMSRAAATFGASESRAGTMVNRISRLAVDQERFPDDREEMNAVGMGAVYTHGSQRQQIRVASPENTDLLLETFFHPYAEALEEAVTRKLEKHGRATIIDVHSFASKALPYELHGDDPRPDICIGYDTQHASLTQVDAIASLFRENGYEVDFNTPFAGSYVPLRYYGKDPRVVSVMLEIRRDKYMDERTGELKKTEYLELLKPLWKTVDYLNHL